MKATFSLFFQQSWKWISRIFWETKLSLIFRLGPIPPTPRYGNASLSSLIIFPIAASVRRLELLSDPWGCFRVFFNSEVFVKWRGLPGCFVGQVAVEMFKIYQLMWERNIWKKWTWGSTIQQYSRNSGLSVNQISKRIQSEMRDFLSCSGEMSFWLKAAVKWKTWFFEGSKTTGPAYDSSQSTVLWRLDWFFFYWKKKGTTFYLRNPNSSSILHREDEKDIYYTILGFSAEFTREFFTVSKLGQQPDLAVWTRYRRRGEISYDPKCLKLKEWHLEPESQPLSNGCFVKQPFPMFRFGII